MSETLPLAFGLEGARAAVYATDGHRFLREGEVERTLRRERAEFERALQRERAEFERQLRAAQVEQERLRRRLEETERGE